MKIHRPLYSWAFMVCLAHGMQAQRSSGVGQLDTNYVKDYSHLIAGRVFTSTKFNTLTIHGNEGVADLRYRPNNQYNLGVGVSYRKLTLNLGFRAPFVNDDNSIYGKTRYLDAQANMFSPERASNLFLQYFQGYHLVSHTPGTFSWMDEDTELPYRPDVREFNVGISTLRMLNSKRFSYRAAFNQDAWQRKSQGSWMLGAYAVYYSVRADSALVPGTLFNEFPERAAMRISDFGDLGPMGGYAYTWVPGTHIFITGSLALGAGLSVQHVIAERAEGDEEYLSAGLGWHIQGRAGVGYNSQRQQVSITYNQERIQYVLPHQNIVAWSVANVRLNFVYRFTDKVPLLDKMVRWLKHKTPAPAENAVPATDQPTPR